ncbi:MAG: decarboxylating NADP(+)-dependent phosphogluconate dehydrogenase [Chloroflexi bacterium]|nr:decarboxylating NADP(+)-dependent phosphogluconate dehydrogenase [Chloroflexota bacterium]MCY4246889.1 decarboxylating NADP(+)-dependent phosphogluconate dehydrogenase [Chloroflexota bacterium]
MEKLADIGLIGLAVMGQNLALNINDHGFRVAVFNRTTAKVSRFLANEARGTDIIGCYTPEEFVASIKRPRKIILMIQAGAPVDKSIAQLVPLLEAGDIIIDGGNSNFKDSIRRAGEVEALGKLFVGAGISGGEEGARHGPSIMPGGSAAAWSEVKPILQAVAAKVADGTPCCDWVGEDGAGHFVKMVHNGIEYGDMQLICEAWHLMSAVLGMSEAECSAVFERWNAGALESFLIEITADILAFQDESGQPLVRSILDSASQKGTGKWTAITALEEGTPLTLIGEAVFARCLSAIKEQRVAAAKALPGPKATFRGDKDVVIAQLEQAVYAAKIISYAQGYMLMRDAARTYNWTLNYGGVALMWREGCIIRSAFLGKIQAAYASNAALANLLLDDYFSEAVSAAQPAWRNVVALGIQHGIPLPIMSGALAFYDGFRSERLPANLLQAQRDYFGAHTYERVDRPRGEYFHTNWTGTGGSVTAGSYDA